jgi:hypothetical protein
MHPWGYVKKIKLIRDNNTSIEPKILAIEYEKLKVLKSAELRRGPNPPASNC